MKRIKKILIANRGEIAVRIHRAATEMRIGSVAVFSEPDRRAPHVLYSAEAYPLDGVHSKETYLDIAQLITVAKKAKCDAIHPGYGFLSENHEFVEAATAAGLIFIGPSAHAMKIMGSKTSARELMSKANVPIIPGTITALKNYDEAIRVANRIGYPILLKAVDGGGGKGMRRVDHKENLEQAFKQAQAESLGAFGSDKIFIEKHLSNPRHIEIQIIADSFGNTFFLGERECSIQRRHQKVVEESPSSTLTPKLRQAMGKAAVSAARECGYVNAGTVEFLVDQDKFFYFLEMNTRLQVEHPITELTYGVDLVKTQIRIAQGEKLQFDQELLVPVGHAIECRIYAEDPFNNFLPSTGKIHEYAPSEGPGIRNDSGVLQDYDVSHFYDPLLAKLVAWGSDRNEAIHRMTRALSEYKISGVATTIPFCRFVLTHPKFINGQYDINFVEKYFQKKRPPYSAEEELIASLAAASIFARIHGFESEQMVRDRVPSNWKGKRYEE